MIAQSKTLVDQFDRPLTYEYEVPTEAGPAPRDVLGHYDAAQNTPEFAEYWANADALDANSANSPDVRHRLMHRSRYEVGNNGYADGIAQTYATDVMGVTGPSLRMNTLSEGFNGLVQTEFMRWAEAIRLREKLWTMAHAKHTDGEAFGLLQMNARVGHPVMLDIRLYEAEQIQSPHRVTTENNVDGVLLDDDGNVIAYELMRWHPGSAYGHGSDPTPRIIPAEFMCHWFKCRRPGQYRGVPEMTSTLNAGAGSRRWREATLAAAETAADFAVLLRTAFPPDKLDMLEPLESVPIYKRLMTTLPMGWDAMQMRAEHPNATYEGFMRSHVSEMARPKSMPYNKAAADSSSYNYASGRLDHQTYYGSIDVDRGDCDASTLNKIFAVWYPLAADEFGWLNRDVQAIARTSVLRSWAWPRHPVADVQAEAQANDRRLRNGSATLTDLYRERGDNFARALPQMATDYGVDEDEMRTILKNSLFNAQNQQSSIMQVEQNAGAGNED